MSAPSSPFRYCLGGQIFLPDIFLTLSHTCLIGVFVDSFETYSAHDWRFFWLKSRLACVCDLLKADKVSPLRSRLWRTLLSSAHLAFRASRHSSSNQGFDFLGMVVALGMLSFAALVKCSTKEFKGSAYSRYPRWSFPCTNRETVPNRPWKTPNGKDHSWLPYDLLIITMGTPLPELKTESCHGANFVVNGVVSDDKVGIKTTLDLVFTLNVPYGIISERDVV